jgi:predicted amidohydrolase
VTVGPVAASAMTAPEMITVALWAKSMAPRLNGVDAWVAEIATELERVRDEGVDLLVLPEWSAAQWLGFAPAQLAGTAEIAWMAEQHIRALDAIAPAVARTGVALCAGTMPVCIANSEYRNRSFLLLPDGRRFVQDKLSLTPTERDTAGWWLEPGDTVQIVDWRGLRLAQIVCLDIEQPALAQRLAPLDLDLILVPTMTARPSGYHRVLNCARARAVELMLPVAMAGSVGLRHAPSGPPEPNFGGAAVALPCEPAMGFDGRHADLAPMAETPGPGPVLIARDIPVGACRRLRRGGAEVWTGPWSADRLRIDEPR